MQTENTTKIIDFNAFREQKALPQENAQVQYTPTLIWYPVWVMMPTTQAPHSS